MQWENVYIFISSTFNDMHAERDYLVKSVFPELYEWCEARKLRLVDIDLRWGVTGAESEAKNTVLACLKNIDACRPFFLCFLGQRRGWVPKQDDIGETTISGYPGLEPYVGKSSVTEMEIEHALLSPMRRMVDGKGETPLPVDHALFFFRNDNFTGNLTDAQKEIYTNAAEHDSVKTDHELESFKDRVRQYGSNVTCYDCRFDKSIVTTELLTEGADASQGRLVDYTAGGRPLKDVIIDGLKAEIEKEFPAHAAAAARTALEADLEQQAQFMQQSAEGFILRDGDFDELDGYLNDRSPKYFLLTAPAGSGKTMLLANYTSRLAWAGHHVYTRFCGASDMSCDALSLWKSIFDEAGVECPSSPDMLKTELGKVLEAVAKKGACVIIIDAVNQIPDGMEMLRWLPYNTPEGLKMIISFAEDESVGGLKNQLWWGNSFTLCNLRPFRDMRDKRSLIGTYLEKYLKSLDDGYIDAICKLPASENALYLKVVLSELRVFGAFKQIEDEIKRFGNSPKEAFDSVLARLENDAAYTAIEPKKAVPFLFGLLCCSRKGLSENELAFCFRQEFPHISDIEIRSTTRLYLRQLRPFLVRRDGRTDFLYESFTQAAIERYADHALQFHDILAKCFRSFSDPNSNSRFEGENARAFAELSYHIHCAGKDDILKKMLFNYNWIFNKSRLCGVDTLIRDYDYAGGGNAENGLSKIRGFLALSAHVLRNNAKDLATQLFARMQKINDDGVSTLLMQADKEMNSVWLKPAESYLPSPDSKLVKTFPMPAEVHALEVYENFLFTGCEKYRSSGLHVWDIDTGKYLYTLQSDATVTSLTLDGNLLYAGSADKTVRVWDVKTGMYRFKYEGLISDASNIIPILVHEHDFYSYTWGNRTDAKKPETVIMSCVNGRMKFFDRCERFGMYYSLAADGDRLFSRLDTKICEWDIKNGCFLREWGEHNDSISELLAYDHKLITTAGDNKIRVWDIKRRKCIMTLKGHSDRISAIKMIGGRLVSGDKCGNIIIWNLETGEKYDIINTDNSPVTSLSEYKGMIVSSNRRGYVHIWNPEGCGHAENSDAHTGNVTCLAAHDGKLISASADKTVKVWDLSSGKCLKTLSDFKYPVKSLLIYGGKLLTAEGDETIFMKRKSVIRIWDMKSGKSKRILKQLEGEAEAAGICEDRLLVRLRKQAWDCRTECWDLKTGKQCGIPGDALNAEVIAPSGDSLYFTPSGELTRRNMKAGSCDIVWKTDSKNVTVEALHIYDNYVAFTLSNGSVFIWNQKDGSHARELGKFPKKTYALTNWRKYLVSADAAGVIRVWDPENGECILLTDCGKRCGAVLCVGDDLFIGCEDGMIVRMRIKDPLNKC
ncbi:MAG: DUF4062 domain-containing protein [Clostridiaceae bacterium]